MANTAKSSPRATALLPILSILLSACAGPQSALDPAGPAANTIAGLWWGMLGFFSLVLCVVVSLWIYASRRKPQIVDEAQQQRIHRRWIIGGGIILPLSTVLVLLTFGIPAGQQILPLPVVDEDALQVEVTGHRWWWQVRYPSGEVITANEFYLPLNQPVDVQLTTADVIHSFWIPRLNGKIDLVPGRTHTQRLRASRAGPMRGQCAEFCGSGHAHMVLQVQVLPAAEFEAWLQARSQPVAVAAEHAEAAQAFAEHCGDCHRIAGVSDGAGAPDLTHVGSRRLLGVTQHHQQRISVLQWLRSHPTFLEGGSTPDHRLIAAHKHPKIAAWLETLSND